MGTDATGSARESPTGSGLPLELIQMLAKGNGGTGSLRQLLSLTQLTVEQHAVVELFLSLDGDDDDPSQRDEDATAAEEPRRAAYERPTADVGDARDARSLRELTQEVADLREVNDTVAAALGACRACWGGDPGCPACAGQGSAGFAAPDPALFRELVVPAVRRARTLGREGDRAGFSRGDSHSPRQRRQFDER